jgi:hypothetical protein
MELLFICLTITALIGGTFLFLPTYRKKGAPKIAIYGHGAFAVTSVTLLTKSYLEGHVHVITMVLFTLAVINGLYMYFISEIMKRTIPSALIILHANLAAIAFVTLIYFSMAS